MTDPGLTPDRASTAESAVGDVEAHRNAPLAMSRDEFRQVGHALVDQLAELLAGVPRGPVTRDFSPAGVRAALGLDAPLPEHGEDATTLLADTARRLFDHSLFNGHPRFFGYITSSPAPIGMFADLLAAAANPNCGAWMLSPGATEIESQTVRWIAELIGYPSDCGGLLVSGGNMANMVGFFAARVAQARWDVRARGASPAGEPRLCAYTSAETHTWIQKGADLAGLGTESVRWIPTDHELRMDLGPLRARIAADRAEGHLPFLVVGTAGSVSTGAVDPLPELADLCREEKIWFHVDGAYGALAAGIPEAPEALRGLARADSVAVDPHKWLYAPLEAGCALVRDPEKLRAAFSYHPPYYHLEQRAINYIDYGPQNSRGFRALKVWLALRQVGAAGYRQMIGDDIRLSARLAEAVSRTAELDLMTQALSITTFRFVPADLAGRSQDAAVTEYLDTLNGELLDRSQRAGEVFVSNAVIGGRYALRACIVNFNTTAADVEAVPPILARLGRELDRELRPAALRGN